MLGHYIARLTQSRHATKIIAASAAGLAMVVGITIVAVSGDDAPNGAATKHNSAPTDRGTTTSQRVPTTTADRSDRRSTTTNSLRTSTTTFATSRGTNGPGSPSTSGIA